MNSPSLTNLAEAAETGANCPGITLLTAGWLVSGVPTSARGFMDATNISWGQEILAANKDVRKLRDQKERSAALGSVTRPLLATIGSYPPTGAPDQYIHLRHVTIVTATGPAVTVPAVQVPLSAVSAWWATTHEVVEGRPATSVGVGVAFAF
jgi:hypothetical protein